MAVTRSLLFLIAAAVCFAIALLLALAVFSGGNQAAFVDGGLLALTISLIP